MLAADKTKLDAITGTHTGTNTGDVTLGAVGSSPNANGASLSGQVITLQPADGSNPGLLTAGAQTIGGAKTFNGQLTSGVASGSVAFLLATGARFKIGGGTTDYLTSDGSTKITAAGDLAYVAALTGPGFTVSSGTVTCGQINAGGLVVSQSGAVLELTGQIANGASANPVKIGGFAAYSTAGAKLVSFWNGRGGTEVANVDKDGAIQLNVAGGTQPGAAAGVRGKLWYTKAAGGVADKLEICLKDAADAYSWVQIKP